MRTRLGWKAAVRQRQTDVAKRNEDRTTESTPPQGRDVHNAADESRILAYCFLDNSAVGRRYMSNSHCYPAREVLRKTRAFWCFRLAAKGPADDPLLRQGPLVPFQYMFRRIRLPTIARCSVRSPEPLAGSCNPNSRHSTFRLLHTGLQNLPFYTLIVFNSTNASHNCVSQLCISGSGRHRTALSPTLAPSGFAGGSTAQ